MKQTRSFPKYTLLEQAADVCVHAAGILFGIVGSALLLHEAIGRLSTATLASCIVYCAGLFGMFAASAAYNTARNPNRKEVLRSLDHAAIFIMIAGSYTPFAIAVKGPAGFSVLAAVWAIAAAGIAIKLRFPRRFDKLAIVIYLSQGWLILFAFKPIAASLTDQALGLLLAGGIIYTLGVPFHLMEWMPFHNAIWHLFVLVGAICQFGAIRETVIHA